MILAWISVAQDWKTLLEARQGVEITSSMQLESLDHVLPSPDTSGKQGVIKVKGHDIIVDFGGSTLRGTKATTEPDARAGTCIEVEGENITIKNVNVHGYKVGLIAKSVKGLHLLNCDFSDNWKQKLLSTPERENEADWMSFHQNGQDEWLRYGAGVYLQKCSDFELKAVKIQRGQCGLMMTDSSNGLVWNCDFSFLSGVGIGLYNSSRNKIMHNRVDWCVRGYSDGVYNRGQDSAGILVYEQSSNNIVAYNSVTHGGDGFFLWAGQTTMDSGKGGCNDNLVFSNDFSHAPTNGIESTFSRNRFSNNKVLECWHGIWGGYSYDTRFDHNVFALNASVMAVEHGQNIRFDHNRSYRDLEGISLWQNASQDPNWGYPKHHDTESHGAVISDNIFSNTFHAVLKLNRTRDVRFEQNEVIRPGSFIAADMLVKDFVINRNVFDLFDAKSAFPLIVGLDKKNKINIEERNKPLPEVALASGLEKPGQDENAAAYAGRFDVAWNPYQIPADIGVGVLPGGIDPFLAPGQLRGRRYIIVDEWGPYDFKSPRLVLRKSEGQSATYDILGPRGTWTLPQPKSMSKVSATHGEVPGQIVVTFDSKTVGWRRLNLLYKGAETIDYRGVSAPAGVPIKFGWQKYVVTQAWTVNYFPFRLATQNPLTRPEAFEMLLAGTPLASVKISELNFAGSREPAPGVGGQNYGVLATGELELEDGDFKIDVTSDDGVRVWVDGKKVIENWSHHAPTQDVAKLHLGKGTHHMKVEYFQLDGYATLQLAIHPD